jgi:hypothetical protein
VYLHLGSAATSHRGAGRPTGLWPRSTPTRRRPRPRLRAAFGFVQVLRIIDHHDGQDQDDEAIEEDEQAPPADP